MVSLMKRVAVSAVLVSGLLMGSGVPCFADDTNPFAGTVVFFGGDARNRQEYPYVGFVHHFTGNLTDNGFLLHFFTSYAWYRYTSSAFPGREIRGQSPAFDLMQGYQYVWGPLTLRGFFGVDYENHHLVPNNPFDSDRGSHVGVKVQGEAETAYDQPYYGNLIASFGSAVDRYWTRARIGYNTPDYAFGPEAILTGESQYDEQRLGEFLTLRNFTPVQTSFSVGYASVSRSRGGAGPYGTLELSISF
jgi:hypothetical protein